MQPHPPFEDRAARAAGATVERVAVLIDFDDDGGVIASGCGLVPILLRHLGEGAADWFDVAVFVEEAESVLEGREITHARVHVMRAPPCDAPQIRALRRLGDGVAAKFRGLLGFEHVLRGADLLQPYGPVGVPGEGSGELGQVERMRGAFLAHCAIALRGAVEHPRVDRGHVAQVRGLHRRERMMVEIPYAVVFAVQRHVLPAVDDGQQIGQPGVDAPG